MCIKYLDHAYQGLCKWPEWLVSWHLQCSVLASNVMLHIVRTQINNMADKDVDIFHSVRKKAQV